jgi:hypothetical protein
MDSEWQSYHDWLSRGGMFDDPDQWIFSAFFLRSFMLFILILSKENLAHTL